MTVYNEKFVVNTKGNNDIIDLTRTVQSFVYNHNVQNGTVMVYVAGSTASVTHIEFEPGLLEDLPKCLERIAPSDIEYNHDEMWHDGNGYAHIRASIIGNSTMIPLIDGALQLGTWQQIILIDFDNKPRNRTIHIQIIC